MNSVKSGFPFLLCLLGIFAATGATASLQAAERLPEDLKGFTIQNSFVPMKAKPVGTIQALRGKLVVRHGRTFKAYYASRGDRLYKHDILYTLDDARCRVQLVTADVITMGADTRISVDNVLDDRKNQKKNTRFSVLKGKAMFYVIRLFRYKTVASQVKTPTAVVGVRGTKFGVKVAPAPKTSARARPLYFADALSSTAHELLAQAIGDTPLQTTVYGFDGQVTVTSTVDGATQTVGAGQNVIMGPTGAGQVVVTPPAEANQFRNDTQADPDLEATGAEDDASAGKGETGDAESATTAEEDEEQDAAADTGASDTDSALAGAESAATDLSQKATTASIQAQGGKVGYFSALLTRYFSGAWNLADVYLNKDPQFIQSGTVSGESIVDNQGLITATNTNVEEGDVYVQRIKTVAGGPMDSGDLDTSHPMDNDMNAPGYPSNDDLGENTYMRWGFWRMSTWVQPGGAGNPGFAVTMRAYRLEGQLTPTEIAAGIVGTYGGQAWGTYFEAGNAYGTDMVGSFSCDVNVPANSINNFNMSVTGGSRSAYISNGTGMFLPGSTNSFTLNGGTWMLGTTGSEAPAAAKAANGSLFGPTGENIGGNWGMDVGGGNNAAVGIFVGDRNGTPTTPSLPPALPPVTPPP